MFGSGFLKVLVVFFLLLSFTVEPSNHNRQRAAMMPMMVGMLVRMVAMLSTEAHDSGSDNIGDSFYT
jgi:glycerol uptake facilitator-like aquaporin